MSEEKEKIESIWASMNEDIPIHKFDLTNMSHKVSKKRSSTKQSSKKASENEKQNEVKNFAQSYEDMKRLTAGNLQKLNNSDYPSKKHALQGIYNALLEAKLTEEVSSQLFHDLCKPIFKCFSDTHEKCRELSYKITIDFLDHSCDIVPVLAYFFPAVMQRIPKDIFFDQELQIFVHDLETHDAYKRGKAVDRQDKLDVVEAPLITVVEPAEEIRLLTCQTLVRLINRAIELGAASILHPYFEDIIMFLQTHLRDPFPEVKIRACSGLEIVAIIPEFELGMKYYSTALVRALLPVLRHKHAKVRLSAVNALHRCFTVPDRAKRKAAGSDAIPDLVGFREENILQISSFYKPDIQVNYLAELVSDSSVSVREQLALMLTSLLTEIGDRYDHQTRLLPYVLDLVVDDVESVSTLAYKCLQICGKQYEEEHYQEILEKKQYGVDGDERINLSKPLPKPFPERPNLGIRLFVRGNTKRFLNALLSELTNWMGSTRVKSSRLLRILVILCEEHLTMEINSLLPALLKALKFARDDKDTELTSNLLEIGDFLGRYILPEIYVFFILPRLKGELDVCPGGIDTETRVTVMVLFEALLSGSNATQILPHLQEIFVVLTDHFYLDYESTLLQSQVLKVIQCIFNVVLTQKGNVMEAFYLSTGRLDILHVSMRRVFKHCLLCSRNKALGAESVQVIQQIVASCNYGDLRAFLTVHSTLVVKECMDEFEVASITSENLPASIGILLKIFESPYLIIQNDPQLVDLLLHFFLEKVTELKGLKLNLRTETDAAGILLVLLNCLLVPITTNRLYWPKEDEDFNLLLYKNQLPSKLPILQQHRVSIISSFSQPFLSRFLKEFIVEDRWNSSTESLCHRLCLMSTLFGVKFPPSELNRKFKGDLPWKATVLFNEATEGTTEFISTDLIRNASILIDLSTQLFTHFFPAILDPSSPLGVRYYGIEVLAELMSIIRAHFQLEKLKSFRYYQICDWSKSKLLSQSKHEEVKEKMQVALLLLLGGFSDGNTEIREAAMKTFAENLQFILSDSEQSQAVEDTKDMSFSRILKLLLQFLINLGLKCVLAESDSEIELMDYLIRSLCVLEPESFMKVLTSDYQCHLRSGGSEAEISLANRLNDLISHAELILALETRT